MRSAGRHNRGLDHGCEDRRQHQNRQIRRGRQGAIVPDLRGNHRPVRHRHRQVLRRDRNVHLRSRLYVDRQLRIEDHLYRRRRRRPALPRVSDRAAGRARRLSRDLLSPALRRASHRRAEGRLRQSCHPPHHGARADEPVLSRLPARCASHGGHDGMRRRALGVLSRLDRHLRSDPAHDRFDPHDREDADAGGDGLQIFDRPAVHLSEERPRLRHQFPAHVLRGAVRGLQAQCRACARDGPHLHPARRPRAECLDLDGAARGLLRRQSVRLHRRRLRLPVGAGARRRQRGRAEHAAPKSASPSAFRNISAAPRTRTTASG